MPRSLSIERTDNAEKGLVIIPGINSGPFGTPFDAIVEQAQKSNYSVVRLNVWEDAEDLEGFTLEDLHQRIDEAIKMLTKDGCEFIGVIGKSFEGSSH